MITTWSVTKSSNSKVCELSEHVLVQKYLLLIGSLVAERPKEQINNFESFYTNGLTLKCQVNSAPVSLTEVASINPLPGDPVIHVWHGLSGVIYSVFIF